MTSTVHAMNSLTELAPVRLVSSSNQSGTYFNGPINNGVGATFTYATGALTIDSVAVVLNDYVLLSGQTNGYENGIYECTQEGATGVTAILTRRGDFQCIEQIQLGGFVPVYAGTAFGGSIWQVVEPLPAAIGVPIVVNANDINFATITASGSSLYLQIANNLSDVNSASTSRTNLGLGSASDVVFNSLTLPNGGLHLLDTNATHDLILSPGSNLTADRVLTLTTGDAARTLDISAASVTISAFAATVLDDANAAAARTTLGAQESSNIKAATTANIGGAGAGPISVVVAGLTASSVVVASIEASSNVVSVSKVNATATGFDITFDGDPGATCTVNYVAFIAAQ